MVMAQTRSWVALLAAVVLTFSAAVFVVAQDTTPAAPAEPAATPVEATPAAETPTEATPATGTAEATTPAATTESATPTGTAESQPGAESQPAETGEAVEPPTGSLAQLWDSFLYYIQMARPEVAKSFGKAILDKGSDPLELYQLSTTSKNFQAILSRGANQEGLKETVADIRKMIEKGYEADRSSPEKITQAIDMLAKSPEAYEIGAQRLVKSGEYAMPQIIQRLLDLANTNREVLASVLPRMGSVAVRPLTEVLQSNDPKLQVIAAETLGQIQYPHAIPALKELAQTPGLLPDVKKAAEKALAAIVGPESKDKTVAALYYDLAQNYYYEAESLRPDSRYDTANVWYWADNRLTYKSVPRAIFNDIYAMRMAARALKSDGNFYPAVSLWIAADLKKEADLPAGAKDATMAATQMPADFYALASSARYLQDVLARALKDGNSAVAMGAISALAKTVSSKSLVATLPQGAQPLVAALAYPDRPVRFLAAITLANALPTERFNGMDVVAPVLSEALRQTGSKTAMLVTSDASIHNPLLDSIRAAGYQVVDKADPIQAIAEAGKTAGIDVIVLANKPNPIDFIRSLRQAPTLAGIPVVVVKAGQDVRRFADKDKKVIFPEGTDNAAIAAALTQSATAGAGSTLTADQAAAWAVGAAGAIRELGLTNNPILDISRTRGTLIGALASKRGEVQIAAAAALAMMSSPEAQQAIATLATKGDADEKVRIEAFNSLTESVKKFGNQLTEAQGLAVIAVVNDDKASVNLRKAAAASLGAMNLPSEKIKSLILQVQSK